MLVLEKLSENLNLLMKREGVTTNVLARLTNIPASTIKKLRNSSNINPTLATLIPIADYFAISIENLMNDNLSCVISTQTVPPKAHSLPVIRWDESIAWTTKNSQISYVEILSEFNFSHSAFALTVTQAESAKFPLHSILLIDPMIKPVNNDFVLTYKKGQPLPTLKQYICEEESAWLQSLKITDNIVPFTSDHRILGVVVEYRHRLRIENTCL